MVEFAKDCQEKSREYAKYARTKKGLRTGGGPRFSDSKGCAQLTI